MATTIVQIARYLNNRSWKHEVDEENCRIFTGVKSETINHLMIVIQLQEDGKFIQFYTPDILSGIQEHEYRELIFRTLLSLSWSTKMVQWEYDLTDGEVRAAIEFPLEDVPLTERQFNRCLNSLIHLVDSVAMPRIKEVMTTGIDPEERELGERMLLMLQETMPAGFLDLLDSALVARRSRGTAASA
jgi:hypothetical protein